MRVRPRFLRSNRDVSKANYLVGQACPLVQASDIQVTLRQDLEESPTFVYSRCEKLKLEEQVHRKKWSFKSCLKNPATVHFPHACLVLGG